MASPVFLTVLPLYPSFQYRSCPVHMETCAIVSVSKSVHQNESQVV